MQETGSNKQFAKLLETVEAGLSLVKQVVYDGLDPDRVNAPPPPP